MPIGIHRTFCFWAGCFMKVEVRVAESYMMFCRLLGFYRYRCENSIWLVVLLSYCIFPIYNRMNGVLTNFLIQNILPALIFERPIDLQNEALFHESRIHSINPTMRWNLVLLHRLEPQI